MKVLKILLVVVVLVGLVFYFLSSKREAKPEVVSDVEVVEVITPDPKNQTYIVQGEIFDLKDGYAEIPVADSFMKNSLTLLDEYSVYGDLDKDGDVDAASWLLSEPGGSGVFHYAVLVINNDGKFRATESMFLGDRIAPGDIEIREGRAVYNFKERNPDDAFTAEPKIERSVWVHYDAKANQIGQWVRDFEGESN